LPQALGQQRQALRVAIRQRRKRSGKPGVIPGDDVDSGLLGTLAHSTRPLEERNGLTNEFIVFLFESIGEIETAKVLEQRERDEMIERHAQSLVARDRPKDVHPIRCGEL